MQSDCATCKVANQACMQQQHFNKLRPTPLLVIIRDYMQSSLNSFASTFVKRKNRVQ